MLQTLFEKYKHVLFGGFEEPKCLDFIIMDIRLADQIKKECNANNFPFRVWKYENHMDGSSLQLHSNNYHLSVDPKKDPIFLVVVGSYGLYNHTESFFDFDGSFIHLFDHHSDDALMSASVAEELISSDRIMIKDDTSHKPYLHLDQTCDVELINYNIRGKTSHFSTHQFLEKSNDPENRYTANLERSLRARLKKYIDRIDGYTQEDGEEKHWEHGFSKFWSLFSFSPETRGINRHANYLVAKELLDRLKGNDPIQNLFSENNIHQLREDKLKLLGLSGEKLKKHIADGINSSELNAVIKIARSMKKEELTPPKNRM